ncbi:MAG: hypothetical protein ABEI27_04450 [Halobellus sp.]|uniref:hypothetical protein n=1 Tax=Halobellus sp. TaxID=1979212 RepID=UPI0035D50528
MRTVLQGIGVLPLSIAPAALLGAAAFGTVQATTSIPSLVLTVAVLPAIACTGYVACLEAGSLFRRPTDDWEMLNTTDAAMVLAVAAGAPLTRVLAADVGLGVVVAAALVGLLADRLVPSYSAAVYCGTFVGMASAALFANVATVTAAGVVAGMVFVAADRAFDGFGGKLGTTAFVGCAAIALATGTTGGTGGIVALPTAIGYAFAGAAAAGVTYVSSVRLGHGPVQASALVGLVGGLVCPPLLSVGDGVAAVIFCASFAGMAKPERVPGELTMVATGALCGLLFAATGTVLVGFGGKLGTIAFTACLLVRGLLAIGMDTVLAPLPAPSDGLRS